MLTSAVHLPAFLFIATLVGACGGSGSALECGNGTQERDGVCVVVVSEASESTPGPAETSPTTVGDWRDEIEPAPAPEPVIVFGDGIHQVGADVKPGLYINTGEGSDCYWEITPIGSSDIVENHFGAAGGSLTLSAGQEIESSGCDTWMSLGADRLTGEDLWYVVGPNQRLIYCSIWEVSASAAEILDELGELREGQGAELMAIFAREC